MQHFANFNYLAVLVAAVAAWIVGGVWYTIFSKPWMTAQGKTMEECKAEQAAKGASAFFPFVLVFISDLIMAAMLYGVMVHVGPFTIRSGLISGALIWFGFVVTAISANYAFQGRKPMLTAIDSGHWLAVLLVIGAILGAFGG